VHDVSASVDRPINELKGFSRVALDPGAVTTVNFIIEEKHLAYYNENSSRWVTEPGDFEARIGTSSRDLKLTGNFSFE
jgi:beta-glucosidase